MTQNIDLTAITSKKNLSIPKKNSYVTNSWNEKKIADLKREIAELNNKIDNKNQTIERTTKFLEKRKIAENNIWKKYQLEKEEKQSLKYELDSCIAKNRKLENQIRDWKIQQQICDKLNDNQSFNQLNKKDQLKTENRLQKLEHKFSSSKKTILKQEAIIGELRKQLKSTQNENIHLKIEMQKNKNQTSNKFQKRKHISGQDKRDEFGKKKRHKHHKKRN